MRAVFRVCFCQGVAKRGAQLFLKLLTSTCRGLSSVLAANKQDDAEEQEGVGTKNPTPPLPTMKIAPAPPPNILRF